MTAERRLLLVSYHFGPGAPTGGFRWTVMAEALAARGWKFDVLCLDRPEIAPLAGSIEGPARHAIECFGVSPPSWPAMLVARLVGVVRALRPRRQAVSPLPSAPTPAEDPAARPPMPPLVVWSPTRHDPPRLRLAKAMKGLEDSITDGVWAARAVAVARRLGRHRRYAAVLVSSPPQLSQLAGMRIGRMLRIPYIADYRDPWVLGLGPQRPHMNAVSRTLGHWLEPRTQRAAALVVHNTPRAMQVIERERPGLARRRAAVANGYDAMAPAGRPDPSCFRILYGGWIHPYMDVRPLLAACGRFRERHALGPDRFQLEFLGTGAEFGGAPLLQLAHAYGLGGCVVRTERVPRDEAVRRQERAAVLAAFDYPHGIAVVMKFYDYARLHGALLLIGDPQAALGEAAGRLGVAVHAPDDAIGLDAALDAAWRRWQAGDWTQSNDPAGLHARAPRVAEMAQLLDEVVRA